MARNAPRVDSIIENYDGSTIGNVDGNDGVLPGSGNSTGSGGETIINPREISGNGTLGVAEPKRRGRKPGSKNATTSTAASANLKDAIASGIYLFHGMLYSTFKAPELSLSEDEANRLGGAFDKLMSCYDVAISKKSAAWIEVGSALSGVYGGRIMHYYLRTAGKLAHA